jgi:hypothetical protein
VWATGLHQTRASRQKIFFRDNLAVILPQVNAFIIIRLEELFHSNRRIHICCSLGSEFQVQLSTSSLSFFFVCLFVWRGSHPFNTWPTNSSCLCLKILKIAFASSSWFRSFSPSNLTGIYLSIEEHQDAITCPFILNVRDAFGGVMKAFLLGWFDWQACVTWTSIIFLSLLKIYFWLGLSVKMDSFLAASGDYRFFSTVCVAATFFSKMAYSNDCYLEKRKPVVSKSWHWQNAEWLPIC